MNCAICGKDNQAGTRFCVHCGAALTIPAAGATQQSTIATAGAILGPKPPSMSTIAPTAPPASTATVPVFTPRAVAAPPPADAPTDSSADQTSPEIPAYNAEPKKAGIVVLVIGVVGLLAVGGYLGYKIFGGPTQMKDTLTRVEAPPATSSSSTTASAPSSATPPPITTETSKAAEEKAASAATEPVRPSAKPAGEPKTTSPAPTKTETKTAPKAAASAQARPPVAPAVTAPPPSTSPQVAAHAAAPATSAAAATSHAVDRWTQFAEELHRCERETFLSRVVCDQRVRLRYCDGYWGKVAQCPGAVANPDRGQ